MTRNIKVVVVLLLFFVIGDGISQNTVSVIDYDEDKSLEGYTLLYPQLHSNVYLINNCGQVVHEWSDSEEFWPGLSVYLLENGDLLKTKRYDTPIDSSFSGTGSGAIVELRSWENEVKWTKQFADGTYRAHHDVEMLPNGNVLVIAWKRRSREEFLSAGGDTTLFNREEIWPGVVLEYNPELDSIVWEWDSWDHIVQDFDDGKDKFGDVKENRGKIDLNYDLGNFGGRPDWIHFNAIDYNAVLDHIVLSASHFEEMWIIDHSTTAEEVRGDTGGNFGKGGQLLFRWGNPRAYKSGTFDDQKLFFQHDVQWIDDSSLSESEYFQKIGLFNNRVGAFQSSINVLSPEIDFNTNEYSFDSDSYLPFEFEKSIFSTSELDFYSSNMSSMQLLKNGNFLVCSAQTGTLFEITPDNEIAWKYKLPFRNGFRIEQGSQLFIGDNVIFRAKKYGTSYAAFTNKSLEPNYYLELDPNAEFCDLSLSIKEAEVDISLYPNPAVDVVQLQSNGVNIENIGVYNHLGRLIYFEYVKGATKVALEVRDFPKGMYFIRINNTRSFKFIVEK